MSELAQHSLHAVRTYPFTPEEAAYNVLTVFFNGTSAAYSSISAEHRVHAADSICGTRLHGYSIRANKSVPHSSEHAARRPVGPGSDNMAS